MRKKRSRAAVTDAQQPPGKQYARIAEEIQTDQKSYFIHFPLRGLCVLCGKILSPSFPTSVSRDDEIPNFTLRSPVPSKELGLIGLLWLQHLLCFLESHARPQQTNRHLLSLIRLGKQGLVNGCRGFGAETFLGRPGEVGELHLHEGLADLSIGGLLAQLCEQLLGEPGDSRRAFLQGDEIVVESGLIAQRFADAVGAHLPVVLPTAEMMELLPPLAELRHHLWE